MTISISTVCWLIVLIDAISTILFIGMVCAFYFIDFMTKKIKSKRNKTNI